MFIYTYTYIYIEYDMCLLCADPLMMDDTEYPDWLWGLLEPPVCVCIYVKTERVGVGA